jgi:ribosome recycling factor
VIKKIQMNAETKMKKSIHALEDELLKLRAGRASTSLLEGILVSYYGNTTPITQVASLGIEGPLMLTVKPWEKQMVIEIDKAIRNSGLGLNPAVSGDTIRVPLPPLSEERRRELIKRVKSEGEDSKVAVRNIRRDANQEYKDLLKNKEITQDDEKQGMDGVQKLTDNYIAQIDKILAAKEADLLNF